MKLTHAFVAAAMLLTSAAQAHCIWASVEPKGNLLVLECAESPGESVVPLLGSRLGDIQRFDLGTLSVDPQSRVVASMANQTSGVCMTYGVHGTSLIRWSARGATDLDSAGRGVGLPLEIVLRKTKTGLVAIATRNGKRVAGATVEAYLPGKSGLNLKTDSNGAVALPSVQKGTLAIGVIAPQAGTGDYRGQHFTDKADMGTLTVRFGD